MIDLLNLSAGERVDLADLQFATQDSILGAHRSVAESFLTDSALQQMWIVRGFQMTNPTGQVLQVSAGVAILALRQGTRILQGVLSAEAPSTQAVDLSDHAAATYGVYVRFVTLTGSFDTRIFWRESAGGQEYSQSVPTRLTGSWEMAVQAASPGSEWLQIGTVVAPSLATTDMRPLYFEGRVDQTTASGWGSVSDRATNRSGTNITNLQTALAALRQSIEDIKGQGLARWFTDHVAGQSIGYASTALAAGRTSWLDDQFYAQGDSTSPGLFFASDGAHLVYRRATGLLVATGPNLASAAGSTTTAIAARSGSDDAFVRHSFYRAKAASGSANIDAVVGRGAPGASAGGLGLYGATGLMGGAGVGLGYQLGANPPALFIGSNGSVGIGHTTAASVISDSTLQLQIATASGQQRSLSFNDGATAKLQVGFANNTAAAGSTSFYGGLVTMQGTTPLAFVQNAQDVGALNNGIWSFGAGSASNSTFTGTLNVVSSPVVVTGSGTGILGSYTYYGQTSALVLNNQVQSSTLYGAPLPARLTLANGSPVFHIDGSSFFFAVRDVTNSVDVLNYSSTTKALTIPTTAKIAQVQATNSSLAAYAFVPSVSHTDTYLGCCAQVTLGTTTTSLGTASILGATSSTNGGASFVMPIRASSGQILSSFTLRMTLPLSAGGNAYVAFKRWDTSARTDNLLFSTNLTIPSYTSGNANFSVTGSLNSESSTPLNGWYIEINITGNTTASFTAYIESVAVNVTTSSLNPQHQ